MSNPVEDAAAVAADWEDCLLRSKPAEASPPQEYRLFYRCEKCGTLKTVIWQVADLSRVRLSSDGGACIICGNHMYNSKN